MKQLFYGTVAGSTTLCYTKYRMAGFHKTWRMCNFMAHSCGLF